MHLKQKRIKKIRKEISYQNIDMIKSTLDEYGRAYENK